MPEQLRTPPLPLGMAYLLLWFRQAARGRGEALASPPPLSWSELANWAALMRLHPEPWELHAIAQLDDLWLGAWRRGRPKAPQTAPGRKPGAR